MSTLNVGTIASKTGNSAVTIADNGNITFTANTATGIATSLTEQSTTSGTTKDFTVPTTAKVIYVSLMGFSFSGSGDTVMLQIGDAWVIE